MGTQPENTHEIQTQTQPNPYPKFGSGPGITLGYPNFGYPIPTILESNLLPSQPPVTIGIFALVTLSTMVAVPWNLLPCSRLGPEENTLVSWLKYHVKGE